MLTYTVDGDFVPSGGRYADQLIVTMKKNYPYNQLILIYEFYFTNDTTSVTQREGITRS